ncbi:MAG: AMP-binding protein [Hyphomicrobiaceae bacterium]
MQLTTSGRSSLSVFLRSLFGPAPSPAAELTLRGPPQLLTRFATLPAMLDANAARAPNTIFLQERDAGAWRRLTYADAHRATNDLASALLELGLTPERPLAILSQNSIDHAVLSLAAMSIGVPVAPISVAYSQFDDLSRLRAIFEILTPGVVFAQDGIAFQRGLALAKELGARTVVADGTPGEHLRLSELSSSAPGESITVAPSASSIAKVLFTSGSTGQPKGVIVTHGMMCSNQDSLAALWSFLDNEPPILVDWLPWNHIFGGALVFNCALRNAGTLVIDGGRPIPGQFEATIRNLKDVPPTVHFGVPRGFDELVQAMERDDELAKLFFSRLRTIFTAGAAIPGHVWSKLHYFAERYGRADLQIYVGWGATETAPVATMSPASNRRPDNIGVPIPGAEIRLVPNEDKLELRVRGPMVTPGYWRRPDLAADAFDPDGFYRIGDAGKLIDPSDHAKGIQFDGRVAENFKLVTGT